MTLHTIMNLPKLSLGSLTNHGRVWAFVYISPEKQWFYELGSSDFTLSSRPSYKREDELELIEEFKAIPQPMFEIEDEVGGMVVTGIHYYPEQCCFSYHLAKRNKHSPYINWIPEENLVGH